MYDLSGWNHTPTMWFEERKKGLETMGFKVFAPVFDTDRMDRSEELEEMGWQLWREVDPLDGAQAVGSPIRESDKTYIAFPPSNWVRKGEGEFWEHWYDTTGYNRVSFFRKKEGRKIRTFVRLPGAAQTKSDSERIRFQLRLWIRRLRFWLARLIKAQ